LLSLQHHLALPGQLPNAIGLGVEVLCAHSVSCCLIAVSIEFDRKKRSDLLAGTTVLLVKTCERSVAIEIGVSRLVNFETASDGSSIKLLVESDDGNIVGIVLTIETVTALLMTLPTMAASAVKRANHDPSLRITYPMREFEIESTSDNLRILTIGTPDGFWVSFSLTEELSQELGEAHLRGSGHRRKTH
jgi:hypothetical protein